MTSNAYQIISADVKIESDASTLTKSEFSALRSHFQTDKTYLYAKINGAHIPVSPEATLTERPTIKVSSEEADKHEIDESTKEPVMMANPDRIPWVNTT